METFYDAINITLENIYKMVVDLKHDVALIKKSFMEEPELRDEFISRMRDIDLWQNNHMITISKTCF